MTSLIDIQEKLLDTQAFIARLEQRLIEYPHSEILIDNLRSVQKRQRNLERAFAEEANKREEDLCLYRLFTEAGPLSITAFSQALGHFQTLFSLVYDALKNGPKERARLSQESVKETALGFGYTFSGSIGMVMTLSNERLLIGDTNLDEAINIIFRMAKMADASEIKPLVNKIGRPPIRAIYDWAKVHAAHDLGADIEWRRQEKVRSQLFIQKPELEDLRDAIDEMSDTSEDEIEIIGDLVGADVRRHSFHIKPQAGGDIHGRFADAIDAEHTVELPKPYRARLRKTTKFAYATEEEIVEYFLLTLFPVPDSIS